MPGDNAAQYRLNRLRAYASVVATRVSVRTIDFSGPSGSTARFHTIFTYRGASKRANSPGGMPSKRTFASHGRVAAPSTISRPGASARTRQPSRCASSRNALGACSSVCLPPMISSRPRKIARTITERWRSSARAAAYASEAGAAMRVSCRSPTSYTGMNRSRS